VPSRNLIAGGQLDHLTSSLLKAHKRHPKAILAFPSHSRLTLCPRSIQHSRVRRLIIPPQPRYPVESQTWIGAKPMASMFDSLGITPLPSPWAQQVVSHNLLVGLWPLADSGLCRARPAFTRSIQRMFLQSVAAIPHVFRPTSLSQLGSSLQGSETATCHWWMTSSGIPSFHAGDSSGDSSGDLYRWKNMKGCATGRSIKS
jgi:hypothetical protein